MLIKERKKWISSIGANCKMERGTFKLVCIDNRWFVVWVVMKAVIKQKNTTIMTSLNMC